MSDDERPRGILAPVDRAYLRGEKEYDHRQSAYDRRETIRERVYHSLHDFPILAEHADPTEFSDELEFGELIEVLRSQIAFAYLLADQEGLDFDTIVEEGIQEAHTSQAEAVMERFRDDPDSVTLGELKSLHEAGVIDSEEYSEAFKDALAPPDPGATTEEEVAEAIDRWVEEAEQESEDDQ